MAAELRVFRVCRAIHAGLDGRGAEIAGGRWNTPGHAVVYLAQSISLAVLENLVHMSRRDFPSGYVIVEARIPSTLRTTLEDSLRARFPRFTPPQLGDRWLRLAESAVLRVRSAVVPDECNFLVNPAHPDFSRIKTLPPAPFQFDARLFVG